jgi:hypothetical protein
MEMIRLAAVSIAAGHSTPVQTARDYYHPEAHGAGSVAEGAFIRDLLTGRSREFLISQWFGGDELAASRVVNVFMEQALADEAARRAGSAA